MRDLDAVRRNEIRAALREAAKFMKTAVVAAQLTWVTIALAIHVSVVLAAGFGVAWLFAAATLWHLYKKGHLGKDTRELWWLFKEMVAQARSERSFRVLWDEEDEDKEDVPERSSGAKVTGFKYHPDGDSYGWANHAGYMNVHVVRRRRGEYAGVWFTVDGGNQLASWFQEMMEAEYERVRDLQVAAGKED